MSSIMQLAPRKLRIPKAQHHMRYGRHKVVPVLENCPQCDAECGALHNVLGFADRAVCRCGATIKALPSGPILSRPMSAAEYKRFQWYKEHPVRA